MNTICPKIFCAVLFFLSANLAFTQSGNQVIIDSLQRFLNENPGSYLVRYDIAELLKDSDSAMALRYVKLGLSEAKTQNDLFGMGKGRFLLGNFYSDYNNPSKGEFFFKSADSVLSTLIQTDSSDRNLRLWVRNKFNIGVVRSYQGYNEDIFYLNEISPVAEKIGYYEILAKANTNLGISFYNSDQLDKAYDYFMIGGPQHLKADDFNSYMSNKLIFASCLLQMDSLDVAKEQLDLVKPILDSIPKPDKVQLYHTVLGEYYLGKSDFTAALANLKEAEKVLKNSPVQTNKLPLYMTFLRTFKADDNYVKGLEYTHISLELAKFYKNKVIESELYKELAYFQEKLNRTDDAFESLSKYVEISDSLNVAELEKEINRLESKFQSEKKEREILQLKNQNSDVELQLAKKQSQNYLLLSVSMGLLVLAVLAYFGYRNFKKRDELKTAEINRLKYEQESKVYNAMLEGQENERKRLAVDLHDGLAGRLSATRLKLEKLATNSREKNQVKGVGEAVANIDASLTELRGIAMNLMPETLFRYGLKNAVEDYCTNIGGAVKDLQFIIQFYESEVELPPNINLTIYRIIQELINNAIKHSEATEVLVQYLIEGKTINITVEDNGRGFSKNEINKKGGMGLSNLKNRVAYLNGEIDFFSAPGEGTTVHIVITI